MGAGRSTMASGGECTFLATGKVVLEMGNDTHRACVGGRAEVGPDHFASIDPDIRSLVHFDLEDVNFVMAVFVEMNPVVGMAQGGRTRVDPRFLEKLPGFGDTMPEGAQIAWGTDLDAARARARESAMPLLVDFGADWCSACRELDHMALSDARVVSEARRFVVVRVDLSDASDEVAQGHLRGYDQSGLPFVVLHHSDGSESQRVTAPMEAEAFLELMRAVR